jgi:hypothetical protein
VKDKSGRILVAAKYPTNGLLRGDVFYTLRSHQ